MHAERVLEVEPEEGRHGAQSLVAGDGVLVPWPICTRSCVRWPRMTLPRR